MRKNTAMMQSQTRNSIVENQLGLYELAIENAELHDIVNRLNSNLDVELAEFNQIVFWTMSLFLRFGTMEMYTRNVCTGL